MKKPILGLLPLYLKLYDDTSPERRQAFQPFLESVKKGFQERGVEVIPSEICRLSPVTLVAEEAEVKLTKSVRGWMKPCLPIEEFLASYSEAGGTHHAAIVYGDFAQELSSFGRMMGWQVILIE